MSFNGILSSNKNISNKNKHHVNSLNILDNKVYLYGGLLAGYNNDIWRFDIILKTMGKN